MGYYKFISALKEFFLEKSCVKSHSFSQKSAARMTEGAMFFGRPVRIVRVFAFYTFPAYARE
jgi:hypothetical protein